MHRQIWGFQQWEKINQQNRFNFKKIGKISGKFSKERTWVDSRVG